LPQGPDRTPALMDAILVKRLTLRGFIVSDFATQTKDFLRDVGGWLRDGKLKYREDVVVGLENAPAAFIGLLKGHNFGKLLVKVADGNT
jgi:NADPH-dependent curcumin reductase